MCRGSVLVVSTNVGFPSGTEASTSPYKVKEIDLLRNGKASSCLVVIYKLQSSLSFWKCYAEEIHRRKRSDRRLYAAEYLTQAYHKGSHSEFAEAIGRVCRARNCMSEVAAKTGLARPALYNALGPTGNPRLSTLYAVLKALNLEVVLKPSQPVSNHDH